MNTQDAKRVLEAALICAHQPMPLRDMRTLFADEVGPDSLRGLLDELARDWDGRGVELAIIAQAVAACGGVNAFAALPALTPTVSWEAAAQSDPQVVATARVDAAQAAPEGRWAELTQVDAVRQRRYALLPPDLLSRMGPRFVDGAQLLCEAIDRAR